jgi:predicted nucleotidyltransferase
MSKDEVIRMAKKFLHQIRRKYDVRDAYLFGSFARGTPSDYSDVDLAVILGVPPTREGPLFDQSFLIFHEAQEFNSLLEVVCFLQEEFDQDGGALARQIKKEGIKLL